MKLTNLSNRFIYRMWSPIYDRLFDRFFFPQARRQAIQMLDLQPGERVLLVGTGTGADLPLLPLAAAQFDAALLNLVLSVVPDGAGCLREMLRHRP